VTTPADDGAGVSGPTLPDGVEGLLALIRLLGQAGVLTLSAVVLAAALLGVLVARKLWPRKQTRVVKDPNSRGSDIDGDGTQPTDFEGESTNPVQEIFARARMELVPDKRDKDDVKLREEIHFYLRDAGSTRQEWKLGRSYEYCECVIDDPLKRISRLHATIIEEGGKFYIRDEGSAGGTYINKRKLTPQIPQQLRDNDLINLNVVAYRFFAGDELGPDPYAGAGGGGQEEGTTEPAAANSWYPPNPDATEKAEADLL
jgi:hypothetical protein